MCERIGEKLSPRYSPPRRGGKGCGINKSREATEEAADGVVSSAKCSGLNRFAELTTPAAPISERIHFIDGTSTPPLRGGEYSAAFLSIANSFTPCMSAGLSRNQRNTGGHRPPLQSIPHGPRVLQHPPSRRGLTFILFSQVQHEVNE